jgi:hypothetical protein
VYLVLKAFKELSEGENKMDFQSSAFEGKIVGVCPVTTDYKTALAVWNMLGL